MSIFGERIRRPEPDIGTILSEYVKKHYVDAQDGTNSEALKQFKAQLVSDVAEYVKKHYIDAQDGDISEALKFFKAQLVSNLAAGRVLRMGLSTTAPHNGISDVGVNISVNGKENKSYGATRFPGQISGVSIFETPLELAQGDTINFKSATHNPKIAGATVSLLIELDL